MIHAVVFFVEDIKTQEARFVGTSASHRHCKHFKRVVLTQNIAGLDGWVHDIDFSMISALQASFV